MARSSISRARIISEAQAHCDAYVASSGALKIHPYDAPETVAGQGTVGLEWEEDLEKLGLPGLDTVLVAVGGGGLIAGIAAWFDNRIKVIGVEPEGAPTLAAALAAGDPTETKINSVAANSLGARLAGALPFAILRDRVERVVLVSDSAILEAQRRIWHEFNVVVEPGGATAYAALMSGAYAPGPAERVGVLLCGGNADLADFAKRA